MRFFLRIFGAFCAMAVAFANAALILTVVSFFVSAYLFHVSAWSMLLNRSLEAGLLGGAIIALAVGIFFCRRFWLEYASEQPE